MTKVKKDLTIGQYATKMREYMVEYTQTQLETDHEICRGGLSSLLRGATFPKQEKIVNLLDSLNVSEKDKSEILANINKQRLHPLIKDPYIGPRIKAIRLIENLTIKELSSDEVTESMWCRVEQSLIDPNAACKLNISRRLGKNVLITAERRNILNELLSKYSEEDLITVGMLLVNKYEAHRKTPR